MATGECVPDPPATGLGGHEGMEDFAPRKVGLPGFLLAAPDVLAIGGVIGHSIGRLNQK